MADRPAGVGHVRRAASFEQPQFRRIAEASLTPASRGGFGGGGRPGPGSGDLRAFRRRGLFPGSVSRQAVAVFRALPGSGCPEGDNAAQLSDGLRFVLGQPKPAGSPCPIALRARPCGGKGSAGRPKKGSMRRIVSSLR